MLIEYKDRHELPDEDAVAIFDHVGYTGGATLSEALIKHYDGGRVSAPFGPMIHVDYADMAHQARDLRFVYGHSARGAHIFFPEGKKIFISRYCGIP